MKGPKGELAQEIHPKMKVVIESENVKVEKAGDSKEERALQGLFVRLIQNMMIGVTEGFSKKLEVVGVGFKVAKKGEGLELGLGFSHPVEVKAMPGVKIEIDSENKMGIVVSGIDKQVVGEQAARIRAIKKPEPYKGKGIKYEDERIFRKAGKTAGAGA